MTKKNLQFVIALLAAIISIGGVVRAFEQHGSRLTVVEQKMAKWQKAASEDSKRIRNIQLIVVELAKDAGIPINFKIEP